MTHPVRIPFNTPTPVGKEFDYIRQAIEAGQLSGDGVFTERCEALIASITGNVSVHLTHSCTAALEMAAILCDLGPGDEVIMPSFTFVSTANAVALRGAVPVFIDISPVDLNLDPGLIEGAITSRTRAIWPIHYAGVVADMEPICDIARHHRLRVVEDAAQALGSSRNGRTAGSFGDMATFSFHETKNVISGEGGALGINDPELTLRAEIIREKGTNRRQFKDGLVDKYTWVDIGSSFLPGELVAAFLLAQLEAQDAILDRRMAAWTRYHEAFRELESRGKCERMRIPAECGHNAHMYYLLLPDLASRQSFIAAMRERGIVAPFHYVPLHASDYGRKCARAVGDLPVTISTSERLVRLPLFSSIGTSVDDVISAAYDVLGSN